MAFRSTRPQRLSADAERLVADALALAASGSRIEDRFWEDRLDARIARLLKNGSQPSLDAALDHLFKINPNGYDVLVDAIETAAESVTIAAEAGAVDALLIAVPMLAQTRYAIPSGPLKTDDLQTLTVQLRAHLLADDAKLVVAPYLYSIDQLPATHADTHALLQRLATAALKDATPRLDLRDLPDTAPVLADPRYLLAVVAAPAGTPLFAWQRDGADATRTHALAAWRDQATPTIARLLPGCEFELLLPDAFFVSCRDADKRIRPLTLRAATNYLTDALQCGVETLGAVIAPFGEERSEEYRVAFYLRGERDVVYGVVWPLFDREPADGEADGGDAGDEETLPLEQIRGELRRCGITEIFTHRELFAPEACDDCGAPLYADRNGELVHAEMPDSAPTQQPLFH